MVVINKIEINDIPTLEVIGEDELGKNIPTVILFHGWQNVKESMSMHGYELAKKGMRAVIIDCFQHGERKDDSDLASRITTLEVFRQNMIDLSIIKDWLIENNLTTLEKIGVAGQSMGGMTTTLALAKYDWIEAAVVFMGTPNVKGLLTHFKNDALDDVVQKSAAQQDYDLGLLEEIQKESLYEHPERLAGRPVHFWHGDADIWVPYEHSQKFVQDHKDTEYGKNLTYYLGQGDEHFVPHYAAVDMANFFEKHLQ